MKYIAIALILSLMLVGCKGMLSEGYAFPPGTNFTPTEKTVVAPDGPTPRAENVNQQEETIDLQTQEFIANEETLPVDWKAQNRVTLLVNDAEKAARLVLVENQEIELPMTTPVVIKIGAIDGERANIIIDDTQYILKADDERNNRDESVLVHVLDVVEV